MTLDDLDRGQLLALVKNIKLKGKKGVGKGTGPRKCYECDGEGHIASECPIRFERVKTWEPERLPKSEAGDVSMGGQKSKGKGGSNPKGIGNANKQLQILQALELIAGALQNETLFL